MRRMKLISKYGVLNVRNHVLLEVTKKCNCRCKHCFTNAGKAFKNEIDLKTIKEFTKDCEELGFKAITISGGEPTLRKDILRILKLIKNSSLKVCLFTNCSVINEKNIRKFLKYVDGFAISLDGDEKIHNDIRGRETSFSEVINSLKLFKKYNIDFLIQSMVTPFSWNKIEWVASVAKKYGAKIVKFSHVTPQGKALKNKEYLLSQKKYELLYKKIVELNKKYKKILFLTNIVPKKELKKFPEKYKTIAIHVVPNGLIFPWFNLNKRWSIGNIRKNSFREIIQNFLNSLKFLKVKKLFEISYIMGLNYKYEYVPLEDIVLELSALLK